jgi:hypothetical protein
MTITNRRGVSGSPWQRPLELAKKPCGVPLINIENRGGQIIRLPTIENSPTATEPTLTAYRKKKSKIEIKFISEYIVGW